MSSLQQPNRFIPFTNSAQRAQLLPAQAGGFPQSLSGSETDVSTSNENLSNEDRYLIRHMARQEPQGQENLNSNRSSLDVSSSSYNTLIIHGAGDEPWTGRLSGIRDFQDTGSPSYMTTHSGGFSSSNAAEMMKNAVQVQKMGSHSPSPSLGGNKEPSNRASFDATSNRNFDPSVREITDIPDDYLNQSQVLKHLAKEVKVVPSSSTGVSGRDSSSPQVKDNESSMSDNQCLSDQLKRMSLSRVAPGGSSGKESSHKLDCESPVTVDYEFSNIPPPPEYPIWTPSSSPLTVVQRHKILPHSIAPEKLSLSRSQPDLSRIGPGKAVSDVLGCRGIATSPRPKTHGREDIESQGREIWPPAEMVEILMQENSSLKAELETCYQKVAKSQKLEQEVGKVHRAHEDLVQSSERRERLERAARSRLQGDVRRLQEVNRTLREQVEILSTQLLTGRTQNQSDLPDLAAENLRKELGKREIFIAQLITQNKELVAAKERQEIELAAQRATLQEQRTHIDILDTALTNAQGNVVRLEEESRKKQMYVERVAQLQRALSSLQLASDRREQTERKLRLQLERELRNERARAGGGGTDEGDVGLGGTGANGSQNGVQAGETGPELKRKLRERDEKIMRLEGEVAKWEQRYLEESALRQAAIDAASIPKDAKIAALEKTSQETEKLIAEARSEKIRHMDEVHAAQKKVADLESRMKDLESKLAERDAMIRVLQKHTYEKDVSSSSYQSMLGRSPHHTPHPSLHGNSDLGTVLGTSVSREELDPVSTTGVFSTVSSVLTSSCSTGISSYAGSDSGAYHHPLGTSYSTRKYGSTTNKSFDDTKKSLDDQLKELDSQIDSQLLSKRGLCCFPGFSNTSTTPRKGKIPKPLLAGVGGTSPHHHLFEPGFLQGLVPNRYEQGRPEEILLLEKQGRSSQQQRMQESCLGGTPANARNRSGSLPPSSLPRPRRAHKPATGKERRLGEYGRLSDGEGRKTPATSCEGSEATGSSKGRESPARSHIPPPRKLGEYGRLSDGESRSIGKAGSTTRIGQGTAATSGPKGGDDAKLRLFPAPRTRRGSSLTRENKPSSADSSSARSVASTEGESVEDDMERPLKISRGNYYMKMPRKCCVPMCRSNYASSKEGYVTTFRFPADPDMRRKWIQCVPRDNWQPTKDSEVCVKHFSSGSFSSGETFSDECGNLTLAPPKHNELLPDAYRTVFPCLASYFSKDIPKRRDPEERRIESDSREKRAQYLAQDAAQKEDLVSTFENFRLNIPQKIDENRWQISYGDEYVCVFRLYFKNLPCVNNLIKIDNHLKVTVYIKGCILAMTDVNWPFSRDGTLTNWSQLTKYLQSCFDEESEIRLNTLEANLLDLIDQMVDKYMHGNENYDLVSHLKFIREQVEFIFKGKKSYSKDTLILAFMLHCQSAAAYNSLRESGTLILPHPKHLQRLAAGLNISPNSEDENDNFLRLMTKNVTGIDKFVVLTLDEIYINPAFEYKNGELIGQAANNYTEVARTIQAFMVHSVFGSFKEVV